MHRRLILVAVLLPALALAACGSSKSAPNPNAPEKSPPGDIPDNQVYVRFHPAHADYSLKVPEGWARSSSAGTITFTDNLNRVSISETPRRPGLPRSARAVKVTTVTRPAGRAVRTIYLAQAAPNGVTGKVGTDAVERYVFVHKGKDLVLTLSGPKGADNVDPWKVITSSVRWTA
jgi:hypothetical protein